MMLFYSFCSLLEVTFADASLDDFRAALAKYQKQKEDIRSMGRTKDQTSLDILHIYATYTISYL